MMIFTPTQKELFNKNIEALSNILLKESLKEIKSSKFELILGKDNLDINLKDTSDNTFLYENVIDELNTMLNTYNDKYLLYPVLYFYGFGNGILFIMINIYFILYYIFMVLEMEFYLKLYCKIKIINILLFLKKI